MKGGLLSREISNEIEEQMKIWRRQLHAFPELAFQEKQTAEFVAKTLKEFGLEVYEKVGQTGVVGVLKNGESKKTIGLRADMDALPILEENEFEYSSTRDGKMHACGHDGHTTMLLGAARELSHSKNFDGTIVFIFQPAEEIGKGALAMMEDGLFDRFPMDEIYGLHNMPNLPLGTVSMREGSIMASEDAFSIEITGKRSHAAFPHLGVDPIVIGAQVVLALQSIVSRKLNPLESAVISTTGFATDGAVNVIPNSVRLTGCVRTLSRDVQAMVENEIRRIAEGITLANGAKCRVVYEHHFINTCNASEPTRIAVDAARTVVGAKNVEDACEPVMASEDFGYMLREKPGCYLFLGTGEEKKENYGLHHQKYDFNDQVLLTGVELWCAIVDNRIGRN